MDRYRRQVLKGAVSSFLGAVVAAAVAVTLPTPRAALVPLTGSSLVLIGAYYYFDRRESLSVAWPAPLVAAAVVVLARDAASIRSASVALALLAIASAVTWRVPAYFARKGQELGENRN